MLHLSDKRAHTKRHSPRILKQVRAAEYRQASCHRRCRHSRDLPVSPLQKSRGKTELCAQERAQPKGCPVGRGFCESTSARLQAQYSPRPVQAKEAFSITAGTDERTMLAMAYKKRNALASVRTFANRGTTRATNSAATRAFIFCNSIP